MTRTPTLIALFAAAALAGCNNNDDDGTIVAGPADPMANAVANSGDIKLPPAIIASHKYRCKDNSLISIDWLSDGTENSARVTPDGGEAVNLTQAEVGGPYTPAPATAEGEAPAEGAAPAEGEAPAMGPSLTGDAQAETVTFAGKSCSR